MKELIEMWKHTRIVSFFILSTALYAVFLWIFAQLPVWIIPGVTSLRPANAIPIYVVYYLVQQLHGEQLLET